MCDSASKNYAYGGTGDVYSVCIHVYVLKLTKYSVIIPLGFAGTSHDKTTSVKFLEVALKFSGGEDAVEKRDMDRRKSERRG